MLLLALCFRSLEPQLPHHVPEDSFVDSGSRVLLFQDELNEIIDSAYKKVIPDPTVLNQYKSFSLAVYGETRFKTISHLLNTVGVTPDDSFVEWSSKWKDLLT